ncbi:hypothetical protein O181_020096 [Austropuccinia psidii MF-1]|uniref:Uncharacterized protein n=1 Tax=Austropuccinia psidii MF-1 TaxID=1389203 RepID=A0A9Q3CCU5_9BASI|nr:hypothetical protein [Austropuccinia psidii MF-1]
MRLQNCPHHSLRFRTPASSSPWLTILTLLWGPQVMPLTPTLLTILTLAVPSRHASNAPSHWPDPYAPAAPSR